MCVHVRAHTHTFNSKTKIPHSSNTPYCKTIKFLKIPKCTRAPFIWQLLFAHLMLNFFIWCVINSRFLQMLISKYYYCYFLSPLEQIYSLFLLPLTPLKAFLLSDNRIFHIYPDFSPALKQQIKYLQWDMTLFM